MIDLSQLKRSFMTEYSKENERIDDLDLKGLHIIQNPDYFCFGIDAVLLAWFASPFIHPNTHVMDLGTGSGILPLLVYGRTGARRIEALEIQDQMVELARRNVAMNQLEDVITVHHGDICHPTPQMLSTNFDVILSNPPYMRMDRGMKNATSAVSIARHEIACTLDDVVFFAKRTLKDRGKLFMVQRADRLSDLLCSLRKHGVEAKRLCAVHPYVDKPANLILVEAMRQGKSYMNIDPPLVVYNEGGSYTQAINEIYGCVEPKKR